MIDPVDIVTAQKAIDRWLDKDAIEEQDRLLNAVRELVENMAEPYKTILWAFYWEGKSMVEIAEENGYKGKDVAKSQKSRCMTKVKVAMTEIRNKLRS